MIYKLNSGKVMNHICGSPIVIPLIWTTSFWVTGLAANAVVNPEFDSGFAKGCLIIFYVWVAVAIPILIRTIYVLNKRPIFPEIIIDMRELVILPKPIHITRITQIVVVN